MGGEGWLFLAGVCGVLFERGRGRGLGADGIACRRCKKREPRCPDRVDLLEEIRAIAHTSQCLHLQRYFRSVCTSLSF